MHWSLRIGVFMALFSVWALPCHAKDRGAQGVDAAWVKAMKANDVNGVVKCYASDAVLWLPGVPSAKGEQAIRSAYAGLLSANTVQDAVLSEAVYKSAGNVTVSWGRFSLTLMPKAGGNPVVLTGRYTEVIEKRNGKWVYTVDHASAEPAGMQGSKQ